MIPPLEAMPWWMRLVVALGAIIIAVLLILVLDVQGQQQHPALTNTEHDARLMQLDRLAIEQAYQQQIQKMFSIWVTDYSSHPPKAIKGAANARSGYIRAMAEIAEREKQLKKQ